MNKPAKPKPAPKPATKGKRFVVVQGGTSEDFDKACAMLKALVPVDLARALSEQRRGVIRMSFTPMHEEMP